MPQLSEINIYPVKSLKGYSVGEANVEPRGLRHDRRWMVVNSEGQFITQREYPHMALVSAVVSDDFLTLAAPGMELLNVPIAEQGCAEVISARVWRNVCDAAVVSAEGGAWLSEYLGLQCRLVRMPESTRRAVNPDYAVAEGIVSFADGYPLMMIGQSSLDDLNSRLDSPVPMDRFRPSLVVSSSGAFAEDNWKTIRIGDVILHVVKPCDRCIMTTIDQSNGEKTGQEPLKTLASYRLRNQKVLFGMQMIPNGPGTIRVGDHIDVLDSIA